MIVGPPGSSKTLAVTVVDENARGEYSHSDFYKEVPTLVPHRYQCSRRSTSNEIKAVFEKAIDRQVNAEGGATRQFVFMDEAGLPEEERESLKVLHYYLEDHMAVAARVGFVAITNHLLDAAKSNRCALLTRAKPDHEELMNVARGCLGSDDERHKLSSSVYAVADPPPTDGMGVRLQLDPSATDSYQAGLLDILCESYDACMSERARNGKKLGFTMDEQKRLPEFVSFFGLRDFMHWIKLLGRSAALDRGNVSSRKLWDSLQRNMNGTEPAQLKELLDYFLGPFYDVRELLNLELTNPLDLMIESLREQGSATAPLGRYKLVIDTTRDDSILRALPAMLNSEDKPLAKILKLSHFQGDSSIQEVNVISQVKWAAEKGQVVLLSQTETVNESFYDLFNQHFRRFEDTSENMEEA
jgi:hypothetical protein